MHAGEGEHEDGDYSLLLRHSRESGNLWFSKQLDSRFRGNADWDYLNYIY